MSTQREMIDKVRGMSLTEICHLESAPLICSGTPTSPRSQTRWKHEHEALDGKLRRDLGHDRLIGGSVKG
jgi:hypothetical protein